MANLIVTFSRVAAGRHFNTPIADGAAARTETIVIPGASDGAALGTLAAIDGESHLEIYAEAACWVAIGTGPEAEAGSGDSRFMPAGAAREFSVAAGHKVSVLEG